MNMTGGMLAGFSVSRPLFCRKNNNSALAEQTAAMIMALWVLPTKAASTITITIANKPME